MSEEIKPNEQQNAGNQTVIINQVAKKGNGIGTAGFILAIIGFFLWWVPVLGWITWTLGLIFSFIGVFKTPRGLSIAGLIVSGAGLLLWITVFGAIFAVGSSLV